MYNIANIIATFCKVYLRLYPYHTDPFIRLFPDFFMFILSHFLYMKGLYVHFPYLE